MVPTPYYLPEDFDFESLMARAFANQRDDSPSSPHDSPATEVTPISSAVKSVGNGVDGSMSGSGSSGSGSMSRSKAQSKRCRALKRAAAKALVTPESYAPQPPKKPRLVHTVAVDVSMDQLRASDNGFTGYHTKYGKLEYTLEDMTGEDSKFCFTKLEWDGRSDMVLVTNDGYQITHCIGFPDEKTWPECAQRAGDRLDAAAPRLSGRLMDNHRGGFDALSAGVSCDMGMKEPKVVGQANTHNQQIVNNLLSDPDVIRLAGLQSAAFCHCQPTLYSQYAANRLDLKGKHSQLYWNFPNSIFAHVTFNFGPRTVCVEHTDFGNRPDGFCGVTALSPTQGGYDYKKGGHMILWDLRVVIEFPPGATILLLSAVLRHSNVAIAHNERRFSFTQYTSGGLFRWVERGFRMEKDFWASLSTDEVKKEKEQDKVRWKSAFANFARFVK
ncbi:hypothetical protein VNI00_010198 [Paramarasmius palmivorus]|uniref:Uncharacterized protein n=1 Tax=Paramarasmius palmivorus TaxID=297713 RepID=A0AAW0CHG0_9AGAR